MYTSFCLIEIILSWKYYKKILNTRVKIKRTKDTTKFVEEKKEKMI